MNHILIQSASKILRVTTILFLSGFVFLIFPSQGQDRGSKGQVQDKQFTKPDFQSLHWLEGSWRGSGGKKPFHETYRFANDTTLVIEYFGQDSTWTNSLGKGSVYFANGFIYHRYYEGGLWAATTLDSASIKFIPLRNANTTFSWISKSDNHWEARLGFPDSSGETVERTFTMKRVDR